MAKSSPGITRLTISETFPSNSSRSSVWLVTAETSSRKSSSSERSRKRTALRAAIIFGWFVTLLAGGLDDFHAGAGSDAVCPGRDHGAEVIYGADASGSLHAGLPAERAAHQFHIVYGGPRRSKAGGGFYEIRPRRLCDAARRGLLLVSEQ